MASSPERAEQLLQLCVAEKGSARASEPIREYLRLVRELRLRKSSTVAEQGAALIQRGRRGIPDDEWWTIMEQVTEASLDVQALQFAVSLIAEIRNKFGTKSQRARRITAMYFEAKGKFAEAEAVLKQLLEDDPGCTFALRRQVALERTRGNPAKAIELLRAYVDTFMTDREAWEELAELYVQAQMYPQAAFCCEELLLHSPQSVPLYVQYADLLYTMGGGSLRAAQQHYAAAVKLSGGESMRALHGLCCCAAALGQKGKGSGGGEELAQAAAALLQKRYKEEDEAKLPLVAAVLRAQGLA